MKGGTETPGLSVGGVFTLNANHSWHLFCERTWEQREPEPEEPEEREPEEREVSGAQDTSPPRSAWRPAGQRGEPIVFQGPAAPHSRRLPSVYAIILSARNQE